MNYKKIIVSVSCLVLFACSSPESDGKKVAEEFCDCEVQSVKNTTKSYAELITQFDSYHFQTRLEAREKVEAIDNDNAEEYNFCRQKAQKKYNKLSSKYVSNREKNEKFDYAFQARRRIAIEDKPDYSTQLSQINAQILTIIPPKPNETKIKESLIGHDLYKPDNFSRQRFKFDENSKITNLTIVSQNEKNDEIIYNVNLEMQTEINKWMAAANITYYLGNNDDWVINHIETKELDIVPTGKYKDCISVKQERQWMSEHLFFYNNCDVTLLVEGIYYVWDFYGQIKEWKNFAIEVQGNSKEEFYYDTKVDYKIKQIEQP